MTRRLSTRLLHEGEPRIEGSVVGPIFQSATYVEQPGSDYDALRYARLNNTPNHLALHEKLASAAGTEAALVTASGMAAISAALMTTLSAGDELLVQPGLYGGTHALLTTLLPRLGIRARFVEGDRVEDWENARSSQTRAVYCEAMTNPLLHVTDLPGIAAFASRHGLTSFIDNTFAGPALFRPVEHGFDLELHSATKSLNGHSDLCAGAIMGDEAHVSAVRKTLNLLGGSLDPHAAWLLQRGLKTLTLRVRAACTGARELAAVLDDHPAVTRVFHPSLASHPSHQRAADLFADGGSMLAFELAGGLVAAERLLGKLELPLVAPSLGGVESLITLPATSSHASLSAEERAAAGISDGLLRVSIGVEDPADLIADFLHALD